MRRQEAWGHGTWKPEYFKYLCPEFAAYKEVVLSELFLKVLDNVLIVLQTPRSQ